MDTFVVPVDKFPIVNIKSVADLKLYLEKVDKCQVALSECVGRGQIQDQLLLVYNVEPSKGCYWRNEGLRWNYFRSDNYTNRDVKWHTIRYKSISKTSSATLERREYRCGGQGWKDLASWTDQYIYVHYRGTIHLAPDESLSAIENVFQLEGDNSTTPENRCEQVHCPVPANIAVSQEYIEISKMSMMTNIVPVVRMENQKYCAIVGSTQVHQHVNSLLRKRGRPDVDVHIDTINLTNRYLTIATIKHPLLAGEPLIPIEFLFHEANQICFYDLFCVRMLLNMPQLNAPNVTIIVENSEEKKSGLLDAVLANFRSSRVVLLFNHILQKTHSWLIQHQDKSRFTSISFERNIVQLLTTDTMDTYKGLLEKFQTTSPAAANEHLQSRRKQKFKEKIVPWNPSLKQYYDENLDFEIRRVIAGNQDFRGLFYPGVHGPQNSSDEMNKIFLDGLMMNVPLVQAVLMIHFLQNHKLWAIREAIEARGNKQCFALKQTVSDLLERLQVKSQSHLPNSEVLGILLPTPKDVLQPKEFMSIFKYGKYERSKPPNCPAVDLRNLASNKQLAKTYVDQERVQIFQRGFTVRGFNYENSETFSVNHISRSCSCGTKYECAHLLAVDNLINVKELLNNQKAVPTKKRLIRKIVVPCKKSYRKRRAVVSQEDLDESKETEAEVVPDGPSIMEEEDILTEDDNFNGSGIVATNKSSDHTVHISPTQPSDGNTQDAIVSVLPHNTDEFSENAESTKRRGSSTLSDRDTAKKAKYNVDQHARIKIPEFHNLPQLTKQNKGKNIILRVCNVDLYLKDLLTLKPNTTAEETQILYSVRAEKCDVSNKVMDAVSSLLIHSRKSSTLHLIPTEQSKQIMTKSFFPLNTWNHFINTKWELGQHSIFCLFYTTQWMLILITKTKVEQQILVYSPNNGTSTPLWDDKYEKQLKRNFGSFFKQESSNWLPTEIKKTPPQGDVHRSGLIVIDYLDVLVCNNEPLRVVNEIEKSVEILKRLFGTCVISALEFKSTTCIICKSKEAPLQDARKKIPKDQKNDNWLECTRCSAWSHISCTKLSSATDFDNLDFKCTQMY